MISPILSNVFLSKSGPREHKVCQNDTSYEQSCTGVDGSIAQRSEKVVEYLGQNDCSFSGFHDVIHVLFHAHFPLVTHDFHRRWTIRESTSVLYVLSRTLYDVCQHDMRLLFNMFVEIRRQDADRFVTSVKNTCHDEQVESELNPGQDDHGNCRENI